MTTYFFGNSLKFDLNRMFIFLHQCIFYFIRNKTVSRKIFMIRNNTR